MVICMPSSMPHVIRCHFASSLSLRAGGERSLIRPPNRPTTFRMKLIREQRGRLLRTQWRSRPGRSSSFINLSRDRRRCVMSGKSVAEFGTPQPSGIAEFLACRRQFWPCIQGQSYFMAVRDLSDDPALAGADRPPPQRLSESMRGTVTRRTNGTHSQGSTRMAGGAVGSIGSSHDNLNSSDRPERIPSPTSWPAPRAYMPFSSQFPLCG
jgi:hypothetical protein